MVPYHARVTLALLAVALATGCANLGEDRRQRLRDEASDKLTADDTRAERVARAMAILDRKDVAGEAPAMRWQAAHNLGVMGAVEAKDLLWRLAFSAVADRSPAVRRECIIALCKMPTSGPGDAWRRVLLERMRQRVAFERTETLYRQLVENDPMVRMALLEGMITLGLPDDRHPGRPWEASGSPGHRDAAGALQSVLVALHAERDESSAAIEIGLPSRFTPGMIETCIRGLTLITQTPESDVQEARVSQSFVEFTSWWAGRIALLPEIS